MLAEHLDAMVRLLEAFGFDVVLIETVGAGQGDTAVRELADAVVLLLQPESGDDIQWEKAGLLEVADIIVIHKADLPGASALESQVRQTLALSGGTPPPVLPVSARTGAGLRTSLGSPPDPAAAALQPLANSRRPAEPGARNPGGALYRAVQAGDPALRRILEEWRVGQLDSERAASALLGLLLPD